MTTEWGTILLFLQADNPRQSVMVINRAQARHYSPETRDWVTCLPEAQRDNVRVINLDGARNRQKETNGYTLTGKPLAFEGE